MTARPAAGVPLASIPGYLIRRTQQVHTALWAAEVGAELTSPQYAVLAVLVAWPGIDQRRLGELASLDKSSVADVVTRLADRRWIVRSRDSADGRRNLLGLSPEAVVAVEHMTARAITVQERLLRPLPANRRASFLRRLQLVARTHPHPPGPGSSGSGTPYRTPALGLDVPGHLIRVAQQVHTTIWAQEFAGLLTGPQYATLHVLARFPRCTQRRLGELAALDRSTASDLVDRLVRRGWVVREPDPADGRGRVLYLSTEARAQLPMLAERVAGIQARLLEPLGCSVRKPFVADLARLAFDGVVPDSAR